MAATTGAKVARRAQSGISHGVPRKKVYDSATVPVKAIHAREGARARNGTVQATYQGNTLGASTVAAIYKDRWAVELFFKALKQNLKIKTFVGTSPNAVKIQVWSALIAILLL